MKASFEFIEELVSGLDPMEFGSLKFAVNERVRREEEALAKKIYDLKQGFEFTSTELHLISQNANIEVIKSIRARLDLGLREAKMLYDDMKPRAA